jgi:hypothetical protein
VFADSWFRTSAVRRLEQDIDRGVELLTGRLDVPQLQLLLTGREMLLGLRDEGQDRVDDRVRGRRRSDDCGTLFGAG